MMMIFVASCSNEITRKGKVGIIWSPSSGSQKPKGRYIVDNGAYTTFNEMKYFKLLEKAKQFHDPEFVVAPDVLGCHDRTLALWKWYYPQLKIFNYSLAFVAQDGCKDVPKDADWIFVGGNDPWKMANVERFVKDGRPVHVGRVNGFRRLKVCEMLGVTSIDGSGWFRDTMNGKRAIQMMEYMEGEKQCYLF
jgi:hypothetical protein